MNNKNTFNVLTPIKDYPAILDIIKKLKKKFPANKRRCWERTSEEKLHELYNLHLRAFDAWHNK